MKNPYLLFYENNTRCLDISLFSSIDLNKYHHLFINDNTVCLKDNAVVGKIDLKEKFAFLLQDDEDLYIHGSNLNDSMNKDIVLATRYRKDEAKVEFILKRNLERIIGEVKKGRKNRLIITPKINNKTITLNSYSNALTTGHVILLDVTKITKDTIFVNLNKIIGHINQPDIETLKIVYENQWPTKFNKDVINEVENLNYNINEEKLIRKDFTNVFTFTIDGSDAKDLDDAISINKVNDNYEIGIHIADVSHFVKKGKFIDKEAFKRSNSLYLADRVIPMLPEKLSNDLCSLNPGEEKLALSLIIKFDNNYNILNYNLYESIISSDHRLTYEDVNSYYDNLIIFNDEKINKSLDILKDITSNLNELRKRNGLLNFKSTELKFLLDDNYKITDIIKRESKTGELLIESLMLLANEIIGTLLTELNLPAIYRIHESPDIEKITEAFLTLKKLSFMSVNKKYTSSKTISDMLDKTKDSELGFIAHMILLRSMKKAKYDFEPIGHFGLGLSNYTHFTAPIRRYSDLFVHRIIKTLILNKNDNYINEYNEFELLLEDVSKQTSENERLAIKIERDVIQLKSCEYLSDKIGDVYQGRIVSLLKSGMFVELDIGIEGFVSLNSIDDYVTYDDKTLSYVGRNLSYILGQKVKVRVLKVDISERKIDFEIIKKTKKGRRRR